MKSIAKTLVIAAMGGLVSIGGYKAFEDDSNKIVIERVPENYSKLASNYINMNPNAPQVDFSAAAERVTPAVVHIRSTITSRGVARGGQQQVPDVFRDFFGEEFFDQGGRQMAPQPSVGSGSGVIISNDGYIVTNNHVIKDADEVEVSLSNKRTYKAKVVGTDPSTDLAVIKIEGKDLPKIALGNSDIVKVGQWVLAVGNPFNLESTVTAGIVSAKGRGLGILQEQAAIESFIQTDAVVNPGNSGGALVNLNGELIGINTAIASPTGSYAGYGFAVPSDIVTKVVEDLIKHGEVKRAMLGIQIRSVDSRLAEEKKLDLYSGVYVDSLLEGSAKAAGLQKGDVITKVNERTVTTVADLQETIARQRPGDVVTVVVNRKGAEKTIKVPLKASATNKAELAKASKSEVIRELGADFENVSASEKAKMGIKGGVKVSKLNPGKLRAQTDIREGFVITHVDKQPVESVDKLVKILESAKGGGGVMLEGKYPDSPKSHYFAFGL